MTDEADTTDIWQQLEAVLADRIRQRPAGSYVAELIDGGHAAMSSKVIEEAYELVEACADDDSAPKIHEAADLVFHLMVLLAANDVGWRDVEAELSRRFGISGLAEKAARAERPA